MAKKGPKKFWSEQFCQTYAPAQDQCAVRTFCFATAGCKGRVVTPVAILITIEQTLTLTVTVNCCFRSDAMTVTVNCCFRSMTVGVNRKSCDVLL